MNALLLTAAAALAATLATRAPQASRPASRPGGIDAAQARRVIDEGNARWEKARLAFDRATFEEMLAPGFYVQLEDRRLQRAEYLEHISEPTKGGKVTRMVTSLLTVQPTKDDGWAALVHEKLEFERGDTKKETIYSVWIARDVWKKTGDRWTIAYSEWLGNESWRGAKPPIPGW